MITLRTGAALLMGLLSSPALAQVEPWGGNVPGWTFSQGAEGRNVNCRAVQGSTVISRVSTGRTYLSVPAPANLPVARYTEGRASVVVGGQAEPVDADRQSGGRLLFFIDAGLYPALTRARGFQWRVSGPGGGIVSGSVALSGDVGKAIAELSRCLAANRSAAAPSPQRPAQAPVQGGGAVVSLYSQSEGGLCIGAAAGMLNIGLVTECRKPPARLRIDTAARRIRHGDQPNLCLSFAVGTFAQINDLMVAPCERITVDLVYDRASMQIRSPQGNFCVGVEGGLRDFAKLKMQPCSPTAPGQRWVLNAPIAAPLARP
jgi:hypothetical protein